MLSVFNRYFLGSFFLFLVIIGLWIFNQKKNFFPVFSINSNLSFKSSLNNDYSDISSIFYIYENVLEIDNNYVLDAEVVEISPTQPGYNSFSVIGRKFLYDSKSFIVYEYKDSKKAQNELQELPIKEKIFSYKNLIIESSDNNPDFIILKEKFNGK